MWLHSSCPPLCKPRSAMGRGGGLSVRRAAGSGNAALQGAALVFDMVPPHTQPLPAPSDARARFAILPLPPPSMQPGLSQITPNALRGQWPGGLQRQVGPNTFKNDGRLQREVPRHPRHCQQRACERSAALAHTRGGQIRRCRPPLSRYDMHEQVYR